MQAGMALSPNSLARRKPGVQIPSPPPPIAAGQSAVRFPGTALNRCLGPLWTTRGPIEGEDLALGGVGDHVVEAVVQLPILALEQAAIAVEGERDGGVAGSGGDLLWGRRRRRSRSPTRNALAPMVIAKPRRRRRTRSREALAAQASRSSERQRSRCQQRHCPG
jgi:hypothetical protein